MTRSPLWAQIHQTERRLAETVKEIERLKALPEYQRDLKFHKELTSLMESFGYEPSEVIDMILARGSDGRRPVAKDTTMRKINRLREFVKVSDSG